MSEVFHLHGIHQHNFQSNRSINTHKILQKKYINKWKKCKFLKKENLKFGLIINARREHDLKKLKNKINIFLSKINSKTSYIDKIILISNFKNFKNKKINTIFSKNSLSEDLKTIYKILKLMLFWNYIIYVNIEKIQQEFITKIT